MYVSLPIPATERMCLVDISFACLHDLIHASGGLAPLSSHSDNSTLRKPTTQPFVQALPDLPSLPSLCITISMFVPLKYPWHRISSKLHQRRQEIHRGTGLPTCRAAILDSSIPNSAAPTSEQRICNQHLLLPVWTR